jgi:hypothetical protein
MLTEQAKKLITHEWFQIDVSFKRVKGEINEFEINLYDPDHHLSKYKFSFKLIFIYYKLNYIITFILKFYHFVEFLQIFLQLKDIAGCFYPYFK